MEPVDLLLKEVDDLNYRIAQLVREGKQDTAADFRLAEIFFVEFIEYFKPVSARREMAEAHLRMRAPSAVITPCHYRLPQLFINDQPVVKLAIFNIPVRLSLDGPEIYLRPINSWWTKVTTRSQ